MLPATTKLMSADDHMIEPPHLWVDRVPAAYRDDCPRSSRSTTAVRRGCSRTSSPTSRWARAGRCPGIRRGRATRRRPAPPASTRSAPVATTRSTASTTWTSTACGVSCASRTTPASPATASSWASRTTSWATRACAPTTTTCSTSGARPTPTRLFGAAILPLNDIDAAVAEFERVIAKGAKAIAFSENPTVLGLPSVHTDHWDPLLGDRQRGRHPGLHAHRQLVAPASRRPTTRRPTVLVTLNGVNSMMRGGRLAARAGSSSASRTSR